MGFRDLEFGEKALGLALQGFRIVGLRVQGFVAVVFKGDGGDGGLFRLLGHLGSVTHRSLITCNNAA